jgi:hypothetical protein
MMQGGDDDAGAFPTLAGALAKQLAASFRLAVGLAQAMVDAAFIHSDQRFRRLPGHPLTKGLPFPLVALGVQKGFLMRDVQLPSACQDRYVTCYDIGLVFCCRLDFDFAWRSSPRHS